MPTVQNAVATKVRVSLGTSLFLGVATAVTFSIGGAMLAGLAPTPLSMTICYKDTTSQTLYKDAAMTTVATSDCGIIRPVTDKPLAITDVVSVMNIATLQFGQTYEFRSGTNTFGTWQRYTFVDGSTSATPLPLSIAGTLAPDGTPIPANVLFIETNLGKLNVCLPEMAAQKTVYVGMSGTVYNDAALTQRSTLHTCATILARAATPSNITAGSRLMNGGSIYLGRESMMYSGLGSFSDYRFDPSYTQPLAGSKAPLRLTHTPGWGAYPPHTYPYTVPADILTLTTDIGTLNLCFPSQTYANENDGNVLFAGTDGSLYTDALLTKRATTETCAAILSRAATPSSTTAGSRLMAGGSVYLGRESMMYSGLGSFSNYQFNGSNYPVLAGSRAPLRLTHTPGWGAYPPHTYPYTVPADILTLTTDIGTLNLCFPSQTYANENDGGVLFTGKDGSLYEDVFLTKRVTTEACTAILARAATPSNITAGSRLMNGGSIYLGRESMMYSGLGSFSDYRFDPSYTQPLAGSKAPLRLTHTPGWGAYPPHTYPYTVPADILTLTTDIGTLNLCFPSQTYANENDGNVLFAGTDGSLYTDALLTKRATTQTCESTLVRAYTPTQVTGASVQEPEFTYWGIDFSRGQYEKLGYLYGYGSYLPYYAPLDMHPRSPLMLQYAGNGNHEQADLPAHTVAVTTNLGTKDICSPIMHVGQDENGYPKNPDPLFVDKNGSTFYDAHLLKSAKACPTVIDREIVIE